MCPQQRRQARPLVATVFGTRPQFIKLAVLWRALEAPFRSVLIDSGQHYDWSLAGAFHKETGLRQPDYHLNIGSAPAAAQIGRISDALDSRFARLNPDAVIVIGDTSTTAAGAIAAAYRGLPVAHVEAGLRSFDRFAPEEKNRVIADHLATWRLCPTRTSMDHLRAEGIKTGIVGVGDLMYEHFLSSSAAVHHTASELPMGVAMGKYYYLTSHRAENVDSRPRLTELVGVLLDVKHPVIYPVHPRARKNLKKFGLWSRLKRASHVRLLPPIPYRDSLQLIAHAGLVLTDSGGVQREAYWSRVPCVILREVTEWIELVQCGAGILTGTDPHRIRAALKHRFSMRQIDDRIFRIRRPSTLIATRLAASMMSS